MAINLALIGMDLGYCISACCGLGFYIYYHNMEFIWVNLLNLFNAFCFLLSSFASSWARTLFSKCWPTSLLYNSTLSMHLMLLHNDQLLSVGKSMICLSHREVLKSAAEWSACSKRLIPSSGSVLSSLYMNWFFEQLGQNGRWKL